ncbi:MAG TPA: type II secretion system protein GspN [Thermodesulfobacteriota bacterium]|nr:type II secretion system protein GspN [Thermodesulfobacteriota bacterium]
MKERFMKLVRRKPLSYGIFFVLAFLFFLVITFPGDVIKERIIAEIESATPYKVEIEKANVTPLLNVKLSGVRLYKSKDRFLPIDSLSVKPSIIGMVTGTRKFPFSAKLLNGEVQGRIVMSASSPSEIEATVKHVTIDSIPGFLSSDSGQVISLGGVMSGSMDIVLEPQPKGDFQFEIDGFSMKDIKVKGMSLPSFTDLKSVLKGNIEAKKTNIQALSVTGRDIDLEITGTTPLLWEIPKGGLIDLGYRLEIKGEQMAKYKTLLSPYLATQRDGSLGGKILGTVKNPRFEKGTISRF